MVRMGGIVPHVAFFASTDIAANTALTISYGDKHGAEDGPAKECRCGAPCCSGVLPFDGEW